jgi:RNA polymerase sigma-B factor
MGLARSVARRFANRGEPLDDLIQVADLALVKAVDRFDPNRGVKFSTYANATISGELKRHFRDRAWAIRTPRSVQERYLAAKAALDYLSKDLERSPTMREVAQEIGASPDEVVEAMEAGSNLHAASLDSARDNDDDRSPLARVGARDAGYGLVEDRALLGDLLSQLPEREQRILRLRFAEGLTQSEIAEAVGLSQMHISRLISSSLKQLRRSAHVRA